MNYKIKEAKVSSSEEWLSFTIVDSNNATVVEKSINADELYKRHINEVNEMIANDEKTSTHTFYILLGKPAENTEHYTLFCGDTIIEEFDSNDSIENILDNRFIPNGYIVQKIMKGKIWNRHDSADIGVLLAKEKSIKGEMK